MQVNAGVNPSCVVLVMHGREPYIMWTYTEVRNLLTDLSEKIKVFPEYAKEFGPQGLAK